MRAILQITLASTLLIGVSRQSLGADALGPFAVGADRGGSTSSIYLPANYNAKRAWPMVLLLHGYGADQNFIDAYFSYKSQVTKRGFILIVGEGLSDHLGYRYWNATDSCCDFDHRQNDDVQYLSDVIKDAQARYTIDQKRIYAAGHSNGGFMAHRLACDKSDVFAAIVSFAGDTWNDPQRCLPHSAVSVLQIQALDDDTIFYKGDPSGHQGLAPYPGSVETTNRWRTFDQCLPEASAGRINITLSGGGAQTSVQRWSHCAQGTSVELWTIDASKHILDSAHVPLLRDEFATQTLDFLLQKRHGASRSIVK